MFDIKVDTRVMDSVIREMPETVDKFGRSLAQEGVDYIVTSFSAGRSAVGMPPGVDTSALRASMRWVKVGNFVWDIVDGVLYGVFLELGTSRMGARPFVNPAFEWLRQNVATIAKDFTWV